MGERAVVDLGGLEAIFLNVTDDSRCPEDAICAWAGDATVHLELDPRSGASALVDLHSNVEPGEAVIATYTIRLVALEPYPTTRGTIEQGDYTVTLEVMSAASALYEVPRYVADGFSAIACVG